MNDSPKLIGDRVLLRQLRESDLDAYAQMVADPDVMRYIGKGQVLDRAGAWRNMAMMMGHWHIRGYGVWAVESRDDGEMIGRVGFFNPEGWPGFEVGWMLRRGWWGKGLATDAALLAVNYAFTQLKKAHIISLIHPDNSASIRLARRLGETFEGTAHIHDMEAHVYGIKRARFLNGRTAKANGA